MFSLLPKLVYGKKNKKINFKYIKHKQNVYLKQHFLLLLQLLVLFAHLHFHVRYFFRVRPFLLHKVADVDIHTLQKRNEQLIKSSGQKRGSQFSDETLISALWRHTWGKILFKRGGVEMEVEMRVQKTAGCQATTQHNTRLLNLPQWLCFNKTLVTISPSKSAFLSTSFDSRIASINNKPIY